MNNTQPFENKHSGYIYNVLEGEVVDEVKSILSKETDMCQCEKCMYDICAITLNHLQPHYITTERGELFTRAGRASVTEKTAIKIEITRAIEVVKKKQAHHVNPT